MDIKMIILSILEVELIKLNEYVNKLFAELQAEHNDNTDFIEQCENFIPVLELCKAISSKADAIQEIGKAGELFDEFLKDSGINTEDFENNDSD